MTFLCIGAILVIFLTPEDVIIVSYFRYAVSLIFTLFLPGYALVRLLFFPKKEMTILELFVLGIILSAMLDIFVGLTLYYTWELSLGSITVTLAVLTIVLLIGSQYLRIQ